MKKGLWVCGAMALCAMTTSVQAKQEICVFDLLGKAGESYKLIEEWKLASKTWQGDVELIPYQDEAKAEQDFDAGKCDAVYMTSMRARKYNKFAGSVDAVGAVTSNAIAQKAISYVLDKRNQHRLTATVNGDKFEVAGIIQVGLAYIFVRDKKIDTIEKAKGKKFAYLHYDQAQKAIVESIDLVAVPSDISDFVKKFNSGQVDVIAAPAYAYKPLEISKGLANGALFNFPVVNITGDLIIRPAKFPSGFGAQSRQWFVNKLPSNFAMVQRLEAGMNAKKITLTNEDKTRYQKMLRDGRMNLTKQGVYDASMMNVLKRARCTVERTNFECTLSGE
ncbi:MULTISPECIES: putative solute-binding protein [Acinetobacter]|uniref:RND transporter n=1 Tax=Acinetobacter colistiniresistens TaxID=280145 RepID=A0A558F3K8_9GAMM|nr:MULTISPECIES: putative solute-binding protein [Acinetobacter]TVT80191.1 RND transporter [Acinetobacter colistiniresistens]